MSLRKHRKRLKAKLRSQIALSPQIAARYESKRWTRRGHLAGKLFGVLGNTFVGLIMLAALIFIGLLLNGPNQMVKWFANGTPIQPAVYPLLASWCVLTVAAMLGNALRIRQNPIAMRLRPWAANFPIADSKLIRPILSGLSPIALGHLLLAVSAFSVPAWALAWDASTLLCLGGMVICTTITSWLLSDVLAAYLPPTPMISATSAVTIALLFVLGLGFAFLPRDLLEARSASSYQAFWYLPPSGWYLSLSGLLPHSRQATIAFPLSGILATALAWWRFRGTLVLEDIQMMPRQNQSAYRRGWIRSWSSSPRKSNFARLADDRPKSLVALEQYRSRIFGQGRRAWYQWLFFPWKPSARQLAVLGLLGLRYPRRGKLGEFCWGLWPVPFCLGLVVLNQFMPLIAIPRFLRLPLMLGFALCLVDLREFSAATNKGELSLSFAPARSLFPISLREILGTLLWNRFLFSWSYIPGWSLSIALLFLTDIPREVIIQTPLLLIGMAFLIPLYATAAWLSGNLRSCWQTWLFALAPFTLFTITALLTLQIGVLFNVLAMRYDLAWLSLTAVALQMCVSGALLLFATKKLGLDSTTYPLSRFARST